MVTKHPRVNVTLGEQHLGLLAMLAEKQHQSVSATARDLLIQALELQEDLYLSELAGTRDKPKTKWVLHGDAWK